MTWQDDQRVLCDALLGRGYRVEMVGDLCVWSARGASGWVWEIGLVWGAELGSTWLGITHNLPEAVALVVEHLDLDGRPL